METSMYITLITALVTAFGLGVIIMTPKMKNIYGELLSQQREYKLLKLKHKLHKKKTKAAKKKRKNI